MAMTWQDVVEPTPESEVLAAKTIRVSLGQDTVNTCNPAVADIDGDGLDEIAVPVSEGEEDRITLFNSQGGVLWTTDKIRLYHAYYDDPDFYQGSHWHYRQTHRHLLTEIADIDGDGQAEVICGDGPITVLDGRSGAVKAVIDLQAHVQLWCTGRFFGADAAPGIVACCESKDEGSFVAAVNSNFERVWKVPLDGRLFFDFIRSGDVDGDGRDEVGFCLDTVETFFMMDGDGRVRWTKNVRAHIADDSHVDDFLLAPVTPGARTQVLTSTGPCLMDADGTVRWNRRDEYHHGQKVLLFPSSAPDGAAGIYLAEKLDARAHGLDTDGNRLWTYDAFTKPRADVTGLHHYLTSSGGVVEVPSAGTAAVAQVEIIRLAPDAPAIVGPATVYLTLLAPTGELVGKVPIEDASGIGWNGPMCAIPARIGGDRPTGLYVITHLSGELLIVDLAG